ncbi:hypothetical protein HY947_05955 [Candidatus Gottesmanbacteria bacterium]|nr:hypothetical protein [Candidatus Gottesmanbacteria bacterium]
MKKKFSHLSFGMKIFLVCIAIVLFGVGVVGAELGPWVYKMRVTDPAREKIIDAKFHQELKGVPELHVKKFQLWEGSSIVSADIVGKGPVMFWYGESGMPVIMSTGNNYDTSFLCYLVDSYGQKISYAYDLDLWLSHDSPFKKWFPLEILTLKDLVEKYDELRGYIQLLPKNQEMVDFPDSSGPRKVLKHPNPEFILYQEKYRGKYVQCDLYQK